MVVLLRAYPRLHFCLLDLGFATPRSYGGAGCYVSELPFTITLTPSESAEFTSDRSFEARTLSECSALLERFHARFGGMSCRIKVSGGPPEHVGLGSKTALLMGITAGLARLNGVVIPNDEVVRLTQRGGASGVGVNGFFSGGLIVDDGHNCAGITSYAPSSVQAPQDLSMPTVSIPMPGKWRVSLILGPGEPASGAAEQRFFAEQTPIPASEALSCIAHVYHGLVPSIRRNSFPAFRESIAGLQRTGFKRREIERHGPPMSSLIEAAHEVGLAAGMSSMGPIVYAIYDAAVSDRAPLVELCRQRGLNFLCDTSFRNEAFHIEGLTDA